MGAHDGDIAPVIAGDLIALFIGAVVLFIDDDEAEILRGAKRAERAPMTSFASPLRKSSQAVCSFAEAASVVENGDFF